MSRHASKYVTLVFAAALAAMPGLASAQCALCKRALESGGGEGLLRGFFWSIILLISLPILMSTAFGWALYSGAKRRKQILAEAGLNADGNPDSGCSEESAVSRPVAPSVALRDLDLIPTQRRR